MRLLAKDTICVMIDVQEKLLPVIDNKEAVLNNIIKLAKGLNALHVPMLVTEHYKKGLGVTVEPLSELISEEAMDKITFSAWENESIKEKIIASGRKNVIIVGIEAHVCVLQTAIDLLADGYQVAFVSDCIGSRVENDRLGAVLRCQQEGGIITTLEALLFELCQKAATPEFKELIKIVK